MEYKVKLTRPQATDIEDFEVNFNNLLTVEVWDEQGNNISEKCRVQLTFSKNALIGFATELLRYANEWKEGKHIHLDPIVRGEDIVQAIGVFLTPGSSEIILSFANSKKNAKELAEKV